MSAKSFAALQEEDRRLVILRVLHDSTDYTCNEFLLGQMVGELGHPVGSDRSAPTSPGSPSRGW